MPRPIETLGQRLNRARKQRGLSQIELAALAGLKQADVSKLETGRMHKTTAMARLARALNVSDLWLELGEGPEPDWHADPSKPLSPPQGYRDRHVATPSEWALLQEMKDAMDVPMLARKLDELRAEVAQLKAFSVKERKRMEEEAKSSARMGGEQGRGVRGTSVLDELDEVPSTVGTGKRGGRR